MSTKAQIKANQQNAQKSTGPQTAEGKAVVSQNAVKHGLFAAESVIQGENEADYEAFHDNMLAELAPIGMVELMLAERVISLWWRLRRAERMQTEVIEDMIEDRVTNPWAVSRRKDHCYNEGLRPGDPRFEPEHLALGRIAISDWSCTRVLDRMLLYERRIESSLNRAMKELKRFQVMRRIEWEDTEKQKHEPSPSLRDEAATRCAPAEKKVDLKKQSQSPAFGGKCEARSPKSETEAFEKTNPISDGSKSISAYAMKVYENNPAGGAEENKAKQSQLNAAEPTKGAGKREKSVIAATG